MNNRIKELYEQAGMKFAFENSIDASNFNPDVFAKLFVEENARLIDIWTDSGRFETFGQRLTAHFENNT